MIQHPVHDNLISFLKKKKSYYAICVICDEDVIVPQTATEPHPKNMNHWINLRPGLSM